MLLPFTTDASAHLPCIPPPPCDHLPHRSEDPESPDSVVYYSTSGQYAALLSRLDRTDLEDALCMSLQELHYDIQRQMALTEEMTELRLRHGAVSYIRRENGEGGGGMW